jgi:four helix bundle protein
MQDFKKLIVWQKSHALMLQIYEASETFPKSELYGFTKQIKNASSSIPFNIAEGAGKSGNHEFKHFVRIALGSAYEVEAQLIAARDLKYLKGSSYEKMYGLCQEVRKMLSSLFRRLSSASAKKKPIKKPPVTPPPPLPPPAQP